MGGETVYGIDYKVRFYPLNGVPFWSYYTYARLEEARKVAEEAVRVNHPLYQGYRPFMKAEVRAGSSGQCIDYGTVVETYRRTEAILRPDLYKFHGMCGQMLY